MLHDTRTLQARAEVATEEENAANTTSIQPFISDAFLNACLTLKLSFVGEKKENLSARMNLEVKNGALTPEPGLCLVRTDLSELL